MPEGIEFIRDLMVILLAATGGGWSARRLGLSPVVGYLAAGLVIGTPQITFIYVTDPARIQVLSQIGLVLLMFAIGTGIQVRKVKELGMGPISATVITALLMLSVGRFAGSLLGMDRMEAFFFASMLTVSSSAIIGKILTDSRLVHQRVGQLALSQTLLEDFVAVVLLAVLGSVAAFGQNETGSGANVAESLLKLGGFVLLVFLIGLVILPRAISKVHRRAGEEMHILLVGGLVFAFAFLSVLAGYSLALGAFLFGMLVAESSHQNFIARSFSGMRDIFTAVFFVAIGMGIDLSQVPHAVDLILWGSLLALAGRILFASIGWLAACEIGSVALKTALYLTPIGEFSFIIAGLGVASGALDSRFQIAAVGIAFVTSVMGPLLMGQADRIAGFSVFTRPGRVADWFSLYREIVVRLQSKGRTHTLWRFLRKRLWQIGRELAWAVAVIVFAQPLHHALEELTGAPAREWLTVILPWFWSLIFALLLIPVVSIIRNIQALAMLVVDYYSMHSAAIGKLRNPLTLLLQILGILFLILVFGNVLPWWLFEPWILIALFTVSILFMLLGWNRLIRLHSQAEGLLQEAFEPEASAITAAWQSTGQNWGLMLEECLIPEDSSFTGQTIGHLGLRQRTGATIIGIERQQVHLEQIGSGTHLFAGDKVFVIGKEEEIQSALDILQESGSNPAESKADLSHAILEAVRVPESSFIIGKKLNELNWPRLSGVHIVAVRMGKDTVFSPKPDWSVSANSELLLAGNPKALGEIKSILVQGG